MRCTARRSGLQDGDRLTARERYRFLFATDHVLAREPSRHDRPMLWTPWSNCSTTASRSCRNASLWISMTPWIAFIAISSSRFSTPTTINAASCRSISLRRRQRYAGRDHLASRQNTERRRGPFHTKTALASCRARSKAAARSPGQRARHWNLEVHNRKPSLLAHPAPGRRADENAQIGNLKRHS